MISIEDLEEGHKEKSVEQLVEVDAVEDEGVATRVQEVIQPDSTSEIMIMTHHIVMLEGGVEATNRVEGEEEEEEEKVQQLDEVEMINHQQLQEER